MIITGWVKATLIRGIIVMRDDELLDKPLVQPVRFTETMPRT